MKKLRLFLIICFFNNVFCVKKIIDISIPKCGTRLLRKCVESLTGSKHISTGTLLPHTVPRSLYILSNEELRVASKFPDNRIWATHLQYNETNSVFLSTLNNYALIFMIRDPRDQLISFIYHMRRYPKTYPQAKGMTTSDLIFDLIKHSTSAQNHPPSEGINDLYERYLQWIGTKDILTIQFEDLVGLKGGGSLEKQLNAIISIADHIGLQIGLSKAKKIASSLFGETETFRKGQIGSWKKHFNAEHKKAFKKHAGKLLIDLGYEKNINW